MASAVPQLLSVLLLVSMGCGPITAASKISDARAELIKAQKLEAPKYAPFEYQGAFLYLEKAREEEGYSYYQDAIELASKAFTLASDAQRQVQVRKAEIEEEARKAKEAEAEKAAEQAK
jgi:hypothetical protein